MNCQLFETVVVDLARPSVMDAPTRESGLGHAETCARCAARLADERALTAGLRSVGAADAETHAPAPRLESALLTAFRARHESPAPQTNIYALTPRASRRRLYAVAAAVLIAALVGLIGLSLSRTSRRGPVGQASKGGGVEGITPSPDPASVGTNASVREVAATDGNEGSLEGHQTDSPRLIKRTGRDRWRGGEARRGAGARTIAASTNAPAGGAEEQIATEFMPLGGGGGLSGTDGGQIVRVEVPRSALASFGLPVNEAGAGGRVKADVVLGDDGVARAIRFVR